MKEVAELAKKILNEKKRISVDELLIQFNNRSKLSELISKYVTLTQREILLLEDVPFMKKKHLHLMSMIVKDFIIALDVKQEEM